MVFLDNTKTKLLGCSRSMMTALIPETCVSVADEAFNGCGNLKSLVLPNSTKDLGKYILGESYRCNNLKSIIFGENIEKIDELNSYGYPTIEKYLIKNANCIINASIKAGTIYGHQNSTAQIYAQRRNLSFVNIDAESHEHDYFLMDYVEKNNVTDGYERWECYCGESSYEVIDHHYVDADGSATCFQIGQIEKVCSVCGHTETEETPALGHNWQEISRTTGNCQAPTEITYQCTRCPEIKVETVDADSEHNYVETVIQPTCTSYGYTQSVCSVCGEEIASDFKSPLGHKLKLTKTTENCTAHGSYVYSCSRCAYTETVAIGADALETETVVSASTCTVAGSEKQVCTLCGATVSTKILPATGHQFDTAFTVDVPATCTVDGSQSRHCQKCNVQVATETIPASGHAWGEWAVTNAPTCTAQGVETRVCANDASHTETRAVAKISHNDANGDGRCDVCGTNTGNVETAERCKYCGKIHNGGFFDKLTAFFHNIAYFFMHMFGQM